MWTPLLFQFFQVEQPGLITPAWVNANWIWLLCEAGTRLLQCKNCVWGGNKIQCMRRGDLHAIITCCLEKGKKKERAWPIDAAIGISADWKHPHKGQVQNKSLGSRFEFLKTSGPNSDRPYTETIQEKQLLETTALLFERLHIFVRHTCKPLSKTTWMQEFGHTCCSGVIEWAAERRFLFFLHWIRKEMLTFMLTCIPKCKRGSDYQEKNIFQNKDWFSMRKTEVQSCEALKQNRQLLSHNRKATVVQHNVIV